MKFRVPEKVRITLGRKYLDWSENLPKFGGGWIREFQDLRQHQRETSEEDYKRSRPPEGTAIEHLSFRLVEVFHLEEFDKLRDGLIRLLPELASEVSVKNFADEFERRADSMSGTSSQVLGYLVRDKKALFLGFSPFRQIRELPPEIRSIKVELFKILPAVFAVTFDVHLTDEATARLVSLQDRRYLPTTRFERLIPWRAWEGGRLSASMLYGSGLRRGFANTEKLTPYATFNVGVQQDLVLPDGGTWTLRFDVLNLFDREYRLRDGTGIGVGAPQFGARRGFFGGLSRAF